MVGLLIYVKKHCIRPEKIGKDTNPLIFQTQLILVRMAKDQDQDQVPVFNVVGGSDNRQRGSGVVVRSSVAARNTVLRVHVGGAGRTARPVS